VNVDDVLVKPAPASRAMPLGLPYPVHQVFHTEIYLTSSVPSDPVNVTIRNPAFFFQRTANVAGSKIVLNYEYRSWTDSVAPDAVSACVRDLNSASDATGYTMIGF